MPSPSLLFSLSFTLNVFTSLHTFLLAYVGLQARTTTPVNFYIVSHAFRTYVCMYVCMYVRTYVTWGSRFYHVARAGLQLLFSSNLPASATHTAAITGVSRCA